MKLLHLAHKEVARTIFPPVFADALKEFGDLEIVENGAALTEKELAARIRAADVLLTAWGSSRIPVSLAQDPGRLRYVCHVTGSLCGCVPLGIIDAGIPVTNWGDAPAQAIAEGAMALLLAALKDLHLQVMTVRRDGWRLGEEVGGGTLEGRHVGIYGCGVIGLRFIELIRPFRPVLYVYDPYMAEVPEDCGVVDCLEDLFRASEIMVIHAGLCEGTRGTVTAELLAMLPDHGVVINTARGAIVDQDALFAELSSGRLRAGLDVLEPDYLEKGHPAREWENCIFTAHDIARGWPADGTTQEKLISIHHVCLDNLRRFERGEPLEFVMDHDRYLRST